jgi:hypothetical protein
MAKVKTKITVDGKSDEPTTVLKYGQGKKKVRSIDELLGQVSNPYSSLSEEQYKDKLTNMSMSEIQAHAAGVGILPISNRPILVKRLLAEYAKKASGYYNTIVQQDVNPKNPAKLERLLKKMAG